VYCVTSKHCNLLAATAKYTRHWPGTSPKTWGGSINIAKIYRKILNGAIAIAKYIKLWQGATSTSVMGAFIVDR
jgi:hypothetical protein